MVDIYGSEIFKKNDIINLNIDWCRAIDEFGFSYYMEKNGEIMDLAEKQKIMLFAKSDK